jgi:hypothetical protein
MDRCPQELIDNVCDSLESEDLSSAYYVSTKFRKAAAQHAYKCRADHYEIRTEDNLDKFVGHYSGFRLRYLKHVELHVSFPTTENEKQNCVEDIEERQAKDTALTKRILWFFRILETIEEGAGDSNRGAYRLVIATTGSRNDLCVHREHPQWRTHLLESRGLPQLRSVISLHVKNTSSEAKLDYRIQIALAERLPNLRYLSCCVGLDEWTPYYPEEPAKYYAWDYDGVRRDSRHAFGRAIMPSTIPKGLQEVELDFLCDISVADEMHQWKSMPNLVSPLLKDPFSNSLRLLSYQLRRMVLRAQVDETLFWPSDSTTPHWPHLEHFYLMFFPASPSGAWYFNGPRGEGRDASGYEIKDPSSCSILDLYDGAIGSSYPPTAEHYDEDEEYWCCEGLKNDRSFQDSHQFLFRISPNEDTLGPFLTSFAKATAHMPELKHAVLWSPIGWNADSDDDLGPVFDYYDPPEEFYSGSHLFAWGFVYAAPSCPLSYESNPGEMYCEARQLWWKVGQWRPDEELHSALQKIGAHKHGENLKEYWEDDESTQGFSTRYAFEEYTPDAIEFREQDQEIEEALKRA